MTTKGYSWKSPYAETPSVGRYLSYYVHRSIPADAQDVEYTIVDQWVERPDLLALDLYGDPDLWIAIPLRNGLQDPVYDLTKGRTVIVPSLKHVLECLGAK